MKKRTLTTICAIGISASLLVATAAANGTLKEIVANINSGITIMYNGQAQDMTDATGAAVYPITYNGSTYVPIRAVSEILGEEVNWDGATSTITLGSVEKVPAEVTSLFTGGTKYSWKILESSDLIVDGSDAPATFSSGVAFDIWNGGYSFSGARGIKIPVDGYETLTFTVWSDIDAVAIIADENGDTITSFEVDKNSITSKEINISGYSTIMFGGDAQSVGANGIIKFFDPMVK